MFWYIAGCFISAFAVSVTATAAMRRIAPQVGLMDRPAARKVHLVPTPMGGGVGVWLGVVVPLFAGVGCGLWWSDSEGPPSWLPGIIAEPFSQILHSVDFAAGLWSLGVILGAGTVLFVLGLLDDRLNLSWKLRLMIQCLTAGGVAAAGVQATVFVPIPAVGYLVTILWIIVLVNAFNFLDNMDGLSSGIGFIAAALFAIVMLAPPGEPRWLVGGVLVILTGSLAGFLCHNWPPARIFMGDSGSYFIGLLLACLTLQGTFYAAEMPVGRHVILAPLCVLAVPLYDFFSVVLIRLLAGRSPFHADKSHFSHRLVEFGLSPRNAVLTIHLATLTTGLGALLLYRVADWSGALIVVALIACVLAIIAILETVGRRNQNGG